MPVDVMVVLDACHDDGAWTTRRFDADDRVIDGDATPSVVTSARAEGLPPRGLTGRLRSVAVRDGAA